MGSDLDDWDYSYKLESGRLISSHVYSEKPKTTLPRVFTPRPQRAAAENPTPSPSSSIIAPTATKKSVLPASYSLRGQQPISKFSDPDPVLQVVDAESDNEFFMGISASVPPTLHNLDKHVFIAKSIPKEHQMTLPKESNVKGDDQSSEMEPDMAKRRKDTRELAAIEQVLREMSHREEVSTGTSIRNEGELRKDVSVGSHLGGDTVKVYGRERMKPYILSRQMVGLSGGLSDLTEKDGFDGNLILAESDTSIKLLCAWLTRDLQFEITTGTHFLSRAPLT